MGLLYGITAIVIGIIAATLITFVAIASTYSIEKSQLYLDPSVEYLKQDKNLVRIMVN